MQVYYRLLDKIDLLKYNIMEVWQWLIIGLLLEIQCSSVVTDRKYSFDVIWRTFWRKLTRILQSSQPLDLHGTDIFHLICSRWRRYYIGISNICVFHLHYVAGICCKTICRYHVTHSLVLVWKEPIHTDFVLHKVIYIHANDPNILHSKTA